MRKSLGKHLDGMCRLRRSVGADDRAKSSTAARCAVCSTQSTQYELVSMNLHLLLLLQYAYNVNRIELRCHYTHMHSTQTVSTTVVLCILLASIHTLVVCIHGSSSSSSHVIALVAPIHTCSVYERARVFILRARTLVPEYYA